MSSTTSVVETQTKTQSSHNKTHANHAKNAHHLASNNKRKTKFDRSGRKRSKSFSGGGLGKIKNLKPVLPTKFLLGGNINDPLNLNSLQDEEINRAMNAVTPKSSPIPTPPRRKGQIEVIIPHNIHDPLHLIDCADDAEYEQQLYSPIKKARKKRLKKRRTVSATMELSSDVDLGANSEAKTPESNNDSARIPELAENSNNNKPKVCKDLSLELSPKKEKAKRKSEEHKESTSAKKIRHSMDKIVSPVIPQPGAWLKRSNSGCRRQLTRPQKSICEDMPEFKDKNKQFQYGNYNRYYGYRNPHNEVDHRLKVFSHHQYLFVGKDILDIGCNIGHITLSVARDFGARSVIGIDIDHKLIGIARKNVKHYVKSIGTPRPDEPDSTSTSAASAKKETARSSFDDTPKGRGFPNNVTFKQGNYVLEDDSLLALEQPTFNTILCLSITKWIHMNWGDSGIKQAFRRMYAQLKPGGKLILEPQNWASYKSKRKLTETIFKNYNAIEFFPDKFTEYLLSPAVGFAKSEILAYHPQHHSKGFRRPIQVFTKSTMFPSERIEAATPSSNVGAYHDSLYQNIMKTQKYEAQSNQVVEQDFRHVYTSLFDRYCGSSEENFDESEVTKMDTSNVVQDNGVDSNVKDDTMSPIAVGSRKDDTMSPIAVGSRKDDNMSPDTVESRLGFDESQDFVDGNSVPESKENSISEVFDDSVNGFVNKSPVNGQLNNNVSGDNT